MIPFYCYQISWLLKIIETGKKNVNVFKQNLRIISRTQKAKHQLPIKKIKKKIAVTGFDFLLAYFDCKAG